MYQDEQDKQDSLDFSRCQRELALELAVVLLKDSGEKSALKVLGVALDFENYLNGSIPKDATEEIKRLNR